MATPHFTQNDFRKATASEADKECVRVARRDGTVELRDDKQVFGSPDDHRLVFTDDRFDAFLAGIRSGETDGRCLHMDRRPDGSYVFRAADKPSSAELRFTATEVAAFLDGVVNREFDRLAYATV